MYCPNCAELREEIRQLKEELEPPGSWVEIKRAFTITTMEARFLSAFINHDTRSHSQIMDTLYRHAPEEPASKTVGVFVHSLRLSGFKITNIWGYGYSIPDEERRRITKALND